MQKTCIIVALQQKVPKRNLTNRKGKIMFDFTKQTKQYEQLAERIKEVNEFWVNAVITSLKQFTK